MAEFNKQDTHEKVLAIISEKLNLDPSDIQDQSTLQDIGADSLDIVEIILKLQEQFNIEIKDEEAEKLQTIDDVVSYIHQLRTK